MAEAIQYEFRGMLRTMGSVRGRLAGLEKAILDLGPSGELPGGLQQAQLHERVNVLLEDLPALTRALTELASRLRVQP